MAMLPRIDDLLWVASTVAMEAGGEPPLGKLAVAWVIVNRMHTRNQSPSDTVLAPMQFSAWNSDAGTRARLDSIGEAEWHESYKAAAAAYFGLAPDPTKGATFYLNVEMTRRGRRNGDLPTWAADPSDPAKPNAAKVTVVIGLHTFMKG